MAWKGELQEQEATGRECFCRQKEDGDGGGGNMGKAPLPKSSWRESGKLETAAGTKLIREKGECLNSIKTVNKGSAKAATPQLHTWWCSGGKGESPGTEWGPGGSWATWGKEVPLLEGLLVETVEATWSQKTPENGDILEQGG